MSKINLSSLKKEILEVEKKITSRKKIIIDEEPISENMSSVEDPQGPGPESRSERAPEQRSCDNRKKLNV